MQTLKNRGVLAVVSGPSGVGKGTVCARLIEKYPGCFLSISATSRSPRGAEEDGVHYYFKSREEFEEMIKNDELLEHAQYVDKYYGTPKKPCMEHIDKGENVILEIEIQGGMKVKEKEPDTVMIFVVPPSMEELESRLRGRGTESEELVLQRLARAKEEIAEMGNYDYIVVNDSIEETADRIYSILEAESNKTSKIINYIKKELEL